MLQEKIKVSNLETDEISTRRIKIRQITGLIFLLILLGILVIGSWKNKDYLLSISRFVVIGERHYTTNNDIRKAILALRSRGGTFITTKDVNLIQHKIESIPWIKQVRVRNQWPDKLKIYLVEYVPVARWNDQHMLDISGNLFSIPIERIDNHIIPMLYSPYGSEQEVLNGYLTMNKVLTDAGFHIKAVSMSARRSWQLTLQDNTKLELGRNDRAMMRLQRFIKIYPVFVQQSKNNKKHINYVDLRYESGFAVSWAAAYIESENNNQHKTQAQA